jgi:hypothetical protein
MLFFFFLFSKRSKGNKEQCPEFQLTFYREVFNCHVIFPVISEALVEFSIFFLSDVIRVPCPNGLGLVQFFLINVFLLNLLGFLFLILTTVIFLI